MPNAIVRITSMSPVQDSPEMYIDGYARCAGDQMNPNGMETSWSAQVSLNLTPQQFNDACVAAAVQSLVDLGCDMQPSDQKLLLGGSISG